MEMGKRYVSNVLMTVAVLLRSGMKRNFHVPFWRAVEEVTLSLTLITKMGLISLSVYFCSVGLQTPKLTIMDL